MKTRILKIPRAKVGNKEDVARWFHVTSANRAESWQQSAQLLILAAGAVEKYVGLHTETQMAGVAGVQAMLLGLALECLLKGRWVADGHQLANDKGQIIHPPGSKSHDLVMLADTVKFELSANERRVVAKLSQFVQWVGRYPIPTRHEQMMSTNVPGRGKVSARFISRSDTETANKVVWRLANEVPIYPSLEELRRERFHFRRPRGHHDVDGSRGQRLPHVESFGLQQRLRNRCRRRNGELPHH